MKYSFDKHKIHHLRDNSRENKYLECLYFPIPLISNYLHLNSYSISHNEWNKIRVGLTSMASMYGNVHHIFRCCLTAIVWGVHFMLCNDESCCFSNKKTRGIHPKPKVHSTKRQRLLQENNSRNKRQYAVFKVLYKKVSEQKKNQNLFYQSKKWHTAFSLVILKTILWPPWKVKIFWFHENFGLYTK